MADMTLMLCKYCGGKLNNIGGNLWSCDNCGTKTIVEIEHEPMQSGNARGDPGFSISAEHDGKTVRYDVREAAVFEIAFDRRATMADQFPTTVSMTVDGRPRCTFEHLPRSGKGSVSFETDGPRIVAYCTGKAVIDGADGTVTEDEDAKGTYTVAGLKVNIKKHGDEDDES